MLKRYQNRSLFYKIILGYLVLLGICICGNVILYSVCAGILRTEIHEKSSTLLHLTMEQIESPIQDVQNMLNKVYVSSELENAVERSLVSPLDIYEQFKLKQYLSNLMSDYANDLFILFNHSDQVISSRYGGSSIKNYYECYYQSSQKQYTDWQKGFTSRSGWYSLNKSVNAETIFFSFPYPARTDNAVLVAIMNPDVLYRLVSGSPDNILLIFNGSGSLLFSSDGSPTYSLDNLEGSYYTDALRDKSYVCQTIVSDSTGFQYVYMVDNSLFGDKLRQYILLMILHLALFVLIGIFMAYRLARRSYRPWADLIRVTGWTGDRPQEAENLYIRDFITSRMEESKEQTKKYNKLKIFSYLSTSILDQELSQAAEKGEYPMIAETYFLLGIQLEEREAAKSTQDLLTPIQKLLIQKTGDNCCLLLPYNMFFYVSIIRFDVHCTMEWFRQLHKELQILSGKNVYMAVSEAGYGLKKMPLLFSQIRDCMKYRILFGRNYIIEYEQIKHRQGGYNRDFPYIMKHAYQYLEDENSVASVTVNQLFSDTCDPDIIDTDCLTAFENDMLSAIRSLSEKYGENMPVPAIDLSELTVIEFLTRCSAFLSRLKETYHNSIQKSTFIRRVKEYIDSNYDNPDLNLNHIADKFSLSAPYLSRQFKLIEKDSIVNYITNTRIEKAKELIKTKKYKIDEIGSMVGFSSSTSFIRVFKKVTGLTPGQYGNLEQEDSSR